MNGALVFTPGLSVETATRWLMAVTLRYNGGNKTKTAESMGISIRTLDKWLEELDADNKKADQERADERRRREEFQNRSRGIPPKKQAGPEAEAGVHMESSAEVTKEYAMPMQKREEVQQVSPGPIAASGARRGR